jgi:hypothetical protein
MPDDDDRASHSRRYSHLTLAFVRKFIEERERKVLEDLDDGDNDDEDEDEEED